MKVYTKIYLLIDSHGNKACATVEDSSDSETFTYTYTFKK